MTTRKFVAALSAALGLCATVHADPVFTEVKATSGGAIQLKWNSVSNALYTFEYATGVINAGTVWHTLYENYPSLGTNSFWTDAGNSHVPTIIPHPADDAMRYYRAVQTATNDLASAPVVTVDSPANNSTVTGYATISVGVTSSLTVNSLRLFVDGEEVGYQDDTATNFVINTCQFGNGVHKIHVVAENSSGSETTGTASDVVENYGVSPAITVTFDNFVTDFRGKLRRQDPALYETNRFTAKFASYADWTLSITNQSGVAVRTVTGSGSSMDYTWDGTDDNSLTPASGGYGVVLSASTSSSSMMQMQQSLPFAMQDAIANGESTFLIEQPPLPPGLEYVSPQNELSKTSFIEMAIPTEYFALAYDIPQASRLNFASFGGGMTLSATGDSGSGGQTTVLHPMPSLWFAYIGTVGIVYQGNHPDNVAYGLDKRPSNGLLGRVTLNVTPGSYGPLKTAKKIEFGFSKYMDDAGYRLKFSKGDSDVHAADLRKASKGGSNIFNNVDIGLLIGHGTYGSGTSPADYTIAGSGPKQSYYPVYTGGTGYDWVRFSEFDFGKAGAGGLKWMCMLTCNNMVNSVFQDCYNKEVLPINDNLHLLCGAKTSVYITSNFGLKYAAYLTGFHTDRVGIKDAWFAAGHASQGINPAVSVTFRVAGWPACFGDDLVNYSAPDSGNPADITFVDEKVTTW